MGHYEDTFFEIYHKVKDFGLEEEFNIQLSKMRYQDKHKFKSQGDKWEYAYNKVKSKEFIQTNSQ
tara:strand:+ start:234 stop:428 length:195 start_codon:yes stop_codon:yes gene_type:complete